MEELAELVELDLMRAFVRVVGLKVMLMLGLALGLTAMTRR